MLCVRKLKDTILESKDASYDDKNTVNSKQQETQDEEKEAAVPEVTDVGKGSDMAEEEKEEEKEYAPIEVVDEAAAPPLKPKLADLQRVIDKIKPLALKTDKQIKSAFENYWEIGKILSENKETIKGNQTKIANSIGWKQQRVSEAMRIYENFPQGLPESEKQQSIRQYIRFQLPTRTRNTAPVSEERAAVTQQVDENVSDKVIRTPTVSSKVISSEETPAPSPSQMQPYSHPSHDDSQTTVTVSFAPRHYELLKRMAERDNVSPEEWLRSLAIAELDKFPSFEY